MDSWKFCCEWKDTIPLPPDYTFAQAFNYLNPETNSFYLLEAPGGNYIQCGGSKERCTVECRFYHENGYDHFVLGKRGEPDTPTEILMSAGVVNVLEKEVFSHWDAIELFSQFFAEVAFPPEIVRRRLDL